jgi:hypothetical protein
MGEMGIAGGFRAEKKGTTLEWFRGVKIEGRAAERPPGSRAPIPAIYAKNNPFLIRIALRSNYFTF